MFAADVDGDGDLDVLSASGNDDKIAWYENLDSDYGDAPAPYPTTDAEIGARTKPLGRRSVRIAIWTRTARIRPAPMPTTQPVCPMMKTA